MNRVKISVTALLAILLAGALSAYGQKKLQGPAQDEIIYHVVQRSFYDSNGDLHGDLNGLAEKLDYLQDLGVTSILLLPLYESVYYHNYFADDFEKIDGTFGSINDYLALIKKVHDHGMKLYMDMETQYVTESHPWYKSAYKNPASPFSEYLFFNGPGNTDPETIIYGLTSLTGYNGKVKRITTVNLNDKKLLDYNIRLFSYWMDPNHDGKFDDGVDGFRLDHMMDDLDQKERLKGLFKNFWRPLIGKLKSVNPAIVITAEQANWGSYAFDYLDKGSVDRVFAFKLLMAIASFNKDRINIVADSTFSLTPKNKQQIVFIENHDVQRFATTAKSNPGKLRAAAALNLLLGGIPSIYYGQELGMTGAGGFGKFGNTDGNDIPEREAFEWYSNIEGKGMALWYKDTGPWWTQTNLKANDGISLEEEKKDPASLWHYYKKLIALRKNNPPLINGSFQALGNNGNNVLTFLRHEKDAGIFVIINLTDTPQEVSVNLETSKVIQNGRKLNLIFGDVSIEPPAEGFKVALGGYGVQVWRLE